MTICVGVGGFVFFLDAGAGVGRLLGSSILKDVVVVGSFLCFISTLVCDVSLWGYFCGVVFCLKISANFMTACIFSDLMDIYEAVRAGLEMDSIRPSSASVAASWLDIPGILLCSGGNSTVSAIRSAQDLFT